MLRVFNKLYKFFTDPAVRFYCFDYSGIYNHMSDDRYLKKMFKMRMGYELDLEHPRRFNEKMQWLKLNEHYESYTKLVDKYLVKQWVADVLGSDCIIPTIGVWNRADEIDFNGLPEQFVLKCNHNSGYGMLICKDKGKIDIDKARHDLNEAIKKDYYLFGREWPYKNVERKIIAEKYMDDGTGQLNDYKLFVFEGKVHFIQVDFDRFTNHRRNFYDTDWNYVPFTTRYPTDSTYEVAKPDCLKDLIDKAEKIAVKLGNPHFLRIDFYIIQGHIYFGEITFYHGSGTEQFYPDEWDYKLGELIKI